MRKRKVDSPQTLVNTAALLFQAKGYHNTTIDDIAEAVGIAKPTLYRYVRSKRSLLEAAFQDLVERLRKDLEMVANIEDPLQQVEALVQRSVAMVADLRPHFVIFFYEDRELPARSRKRFRDQARQINRTVAAIFERNAARGALRSDVDPKLAALLFLGMVTSMARWYDPAGPLNREEMARVLLKFLSGYLIAPRAEPLVGPSPQANRVRE